MAAERTYVTPPEPTRDIDIVDEPIGGPLHWSSIVGGWLIGLTLFAFLALIGVATGLSAFNAGTAASTGNVPAAQAGTSSALWGAISSVISFLVGGYFAGRIVNAEERDRGAANGVMVFLLSVPFMLLMAGVGASGVLSGLGGLAGGVFAGTGGQAANQAAGSVAPIDVAQATSTMRNAAWSGLVIALVCLAASAIGGFLGARPEHEVHVERRRAPIAVGRH